MFEIKSGDFCSWVKHPLLSPASAGLEQAEHVEGRKLSQGSTLTSSPEYSQRASVANFLAFKQTEKAWTKFLLQCT